MRKHTHHVRLTSQRVSSYISMVILGVLCVTGSFAVGVQTAGDVETVGSILAESPEIVGDMDGNGALDPRDVAMILEVVQGYRDADPALLRRDPNGDGELTVDDALSVLDDLASF